MKVLNLTLNKKSGTESVSFSVKRMVNAGYVGRDRDALQRHIEEMIKEGISTPEETSTPHGVADSIA